MKMRTLVLAALLAILTSGCITVRIETKIREDGSGAKSFILALDKSVMSMMESMAEESGATTDDIWAEIRAGADTVKGATVEEYTNDESEGIKVTIPFGNLDELAALSGSDAFEGADTINVSQDGDVTTLNVTVMVGDITSGFSEAGDQSIEGFDLGDIDLEYTYAIEVEGKILGYLPKDSATVEGNKVTWDLTQAQAETVQLMIKWEPGGGFDILVILLAIAAVGGLVLVAIGVVLLLRSRKPTPAPIDSDRGQD